MDFNKIVSIAIGFMIIILLFVWINSRLNSQKDVKISVNTPTPTATVTKITQSPTPEKEPSWLQNIANLFRKSSTQSPTPIIKQTSKSNTANKSTIKIVEVSPSPSVKTNKENSDNVVYSITQPTEIPQTGIPTVVVPITLLTLAFGLYLRKS